MNEKKINSKQAESLFNHLLNDEKEDLIKNEQSYLYRGLRIQISQHNLTTSQRVMKLYKKRRSAGLCTQCGKKVKKINPRTKELYRLCDYHREKIDHKK